MRELTEDERTLRDRKRAAFAQFLSERIPVLTDFAEDLGMKDPAKVVADPEAYLAGIDAYMKQQQVGQDDMWWIVARIGYFVGEVLAQRFSGRWMIDEVPDSRYFLRYVVGEFGRCRNLGAMVDPVEAAYDYCRLPPGRDLTALVDQISAELRKA